MGNAVVTCTGKMLQYGFESNSTNTFFISLQSKETQKVHRSFMLFSACEHKNRAPVRPIFRSGACFALVLPEFAFFRPKSKEKPLLSW